MQTRHLICGKISAIVAINPQMTRQKFNLSSHIFCYWLRKFIFTSIKSRKYSWRTSSFAKLLCLHKFTSTNPINSFFCESFKRVQRNLQCENSFMHDITLSTLIVYADISYVKNLPKFLFTPQYTTHAHNTICSLPVKRKQFFIKIQKYTIWPQKSV